MEHNRNLSSVIQSIRDQGPSSLAREGASGGRDSVDHMDLDEPVAQDRHTGRSVSQIFFIAVLAGLVVAAGVLFVVGGSSVYFSGAPDGSSTTTAADTQVVDGQLVEIREAQAHLGSRVDQLAAAIADMSVIITQWNEQQGDVQQAVQTDVQSGLKDRSSGVHLDAPVQQDLLSSRNNVVVGIPVAEAADLPVPQDEIIMAAATNEPDPVAITQPDEDAVTAEPDAEQDSVEQGWVINVAYSGKQAQIQKLKKKLGEAGITTEQQQVTIGGRPGYRLRIPGFSTSKTASEYARNNLGQDLGLKDPWVSRR